MKKMCLLSFGLLVAQDMRFPIIPPYDLRTDARYTQYMPDRVKTLVRTIERDGLTAAVAGVEQDLDFESDVFILAVNKPVILLAYSRKPEVSNKKVTEFKDTFLFDQHSEQTLEALYNLFIATARQGPTYLPYAADASSNNASVFHLAYVQLLNLENKQYVVGVTVQVASIPDVLILPQRVKTLLSYLKKDNFGEWVKLINNDPNSYIYFFVCSLDYPYRWLAHGHSNKFVTKRANEIEKELYGVCNEDACDVTKISKRLVRVAKHGGGFVAYAYHSRKEDPVRLRFVYVQPFRYQKKKLFLAVNYTSIDFPDNLRTALPEAVDNMINLIHDIGLPNAVSLAKKTNKPELYIFVLEQEPPYRSFVQLEPEIATNAEEATKFSRKQKGFTVNYQQLRMSMSNFVHEDSGFFAYVYHAPKAKAHTVLKTAYLKMITVDDKNYTIGATYEKLR
jgi:hypothetical protein